MSGEREEHVVECRPPNLDVEDLDPGIIERADHAGHDPVAGPDRGVESDPVFVGDHSAGGDAVEHRHRRAGIGGRGDHNPEVITADPALELVGRALGDHLAMIDDDDPGGEAIGLIEVLRGEQHGGAVLLELLDQIPHRQAAARVESGCRLVEEQHRRAGDQAHCDVEPPAHAARVALDDPVGGVDQLEPLEQRPCALDDVAARQVEQSRHMLHVLAAGQSFVDRRVLAREADARAHLVRVGNDVDPVDPRCALLGTQQRREDPDGGGLAGAVRAQQPVDRTARHRQVDAVERQVVAEALDEARCFNRQLIPGHAGHCCRREWLARGHLRGQPSHGVPH